jgi:hypothetical protein
VNFFQSSDIKKKKKSFFHADEKEAAKEKQIKTTFFN